MKYNIILIVKENKFDYSRVRNELIFNYIIIIKIKSSNGILLIFIWFKYKLFKLIIVRSKVFCSFLILTELV